MTNIAILGYGTVGSGVVEVININQTSIDKKTGDNVYIKYILDIRDFEGDSIQEKITHNFDDILNDDTIKVVVEVMGGIEPAYTFVKKSLLKYKSVVTSNKELVAKYGAELIKLAQQQNVNFLFEASVGGGIPIIRPLNQSLTADEIYEIDGILNGTTNFILTKMSQDDREFEDVLKEAQDKGYAERNPSADIQGHDSARKIAILSSLAFGLQVDYEDIETVGITDITKEDMIYVKFMSKQIKLIASSKKINDNIFARVSPKIINNENPLVTVNDVFNAIVVRGNMIGDVMFYGKGAGKLPTASAVVSDIIDVIKHGNKNIIQFWAPEKVHVMSATKELVAFFVRVAYNTVEEPAINNLDNVIELIKGFFGSVKIINLEQFEDEIAFITNIEEEGLLRQKLENLKTQKEIKQIRSIINYEK